MNARIPTLAALALTLAACGDRTEYAAPADSAAIPGYDPDTTMAPPPVMDSSMQQAAPSTDSVPAATAPVPDSAHP